jgi:hypothetical protein
MRAKQRGEHPRSRTSNSDSFPVPNMRRRGFLLTLGVGGAGAAAVAVRSWTAAAPVEGGAETAVGSKGYQATDHVRRYYETTKT